MLKADEEEVANMWADLIDSDFVKRPDSGDMMGDENDFGMDSEGEQDQ